jgi:hypothetical protein
MSVDAGEDAVNELLTLIIADKSRAAKRKLQGAERELELAKDSLLKLLERRDTRTSISVKKRLEAVEQALTGETIDTGEANKALKAAVHKMVMRPAEGALEIHWHHADEPQEVVFMTRRYIWNANQIENITEEEAGI